jgi:hypothetical protein
VTQLLSDGRLLGDGGLLQLAGKHLQLFTAVAATLDFFGAIADPHDESPGNLVNMRA